MSKVKPKLNLKEKIIDDCLDLSMCDLDKVPIKEILEIPKIKRLNLSYNKLTNLPVDFAKLQHIKEIDLSKNHLKTLPDNFGSLISLRTLDLLGNDIVSLPACFSELKSLQWLDLKENPLDPELRKIAGECGDEAQCKKCAINVVRYMKQVAAEEERKRQVELRKKKEELAKQEAIEKEKEKELKLKKKLEREQKKLLAEQKKKELHDERSFEQEKTSSPVKSSIQVTSIKQKGCCQTIFSVLSFMFFFTLIFAGSYFILNNYCETGNKLRAQIRSYTNLAPITQFVDQKMCPTINANKIPYQNLIKLFQQINF